MAISEQQFSELQHRVARLEMQVRLAQSSDLTRSAQIHQLQGGLPPLTERMDVLENDVRTLRRGGENGS
jgi:hypothetical protein